MNGYAVTVEVTLTEVAGEPDWWIVQLWTPNLDRRVTLVDQDRCPLFTALRKVALASGVALAPEAE